MTPRETADSVPASSRLDACRHEVRAAYAIWLRELTRVQVSAFARALILPVIYFFAMGHGIGSNFRPTGAPPGFSYLAFLLPGILGMTVIFPALFSSASVIWDREFGFLKGVLVAPVSRTSIVIGKALGGASVAWLQSVVFLFVTPFVHISLAPGQIARMCATIFLTAFVLACLGLIVASRVSNIEGFQLVMDLLGNPMWLLSGAFFPLRDLPAWLAIVMRLNPLSYGVDALRGVVYRGDEFAPLFVAHSYAVDMSIIAGFALGTFALAVLTFTSRAR